MSQEQQRVITWISNNIWTIIVVGSLFIQIVPIKINPWTALFQWVGKAITSKACGKLDGVISQITDFGSDIDKLKIEVGNIKLDVDTINGNIDTMTDELRTNEKDRIRWEILDFANSCRNGRKHTYDEFKHIIDLNDKYKKLLGQTGDRNGVFEAEYEYIRKLFEKRQEKNDFLTSNGDE